MTDVALVYPYFDPPSNNSAFRFPPLGLGYVASYLRENGVSVGLIDCSFQREAEALQRVRELRPRIVGVYSMFTMREASLRFARSLRDGCELLVAGGPLPTIEPEPFLSDFDVVAVGEGERTILEIVRAFESGDNLRTVNGIVYRENDGHLVRSQDSGSEIVHTPRREPAANLDEIPFPARDLFGNEAYMRYYRLRVGYTTTSIMTSRGCPFSCDFCSRPVFGNQFRERSAGNIVDEIEEILALGYDRVFFNDDCFTLTKARVLRVCDEIERRVLRFGWECLSRVDTIDEQVAARMRRAGCRRIFFGLESGNDSILKIMNKGATVERARRAVEASASAGIKTGAFFILGYPGETDETILDTIRFATSLPLDYLSFTFPYPIPGTGLYEKVKDSLIERDPDHPRRKLVDHRLIYRSDFSQGKLVFATLKAMGQFYTRRYLGRFSPVVGEPFRIVTDRALRMLR